MQHRVIDIKDNRPIKFDTAAGNELPALSPCRPSSEATALIQKHIHTLGQTEMAVQYLATSALLRIGPDAVPWLLDVLANPNWGVREIAAVEALKRFGDPRAIPVLEEFLEHGDETQRLQSIKALRWHHAGPEPYQRALPDTNWKVRLEAIFALSDIGRKSFLPTFAAALKDEHFRVRAAAANALGRLRDSRAVKHLSRAMEDEHSRVKTMAVWSLQHIGGTQDTEAILETLNSDDCELRRTAIRALGRLHGLMEGGCQGLNEEIVAALGMIADSRAVEPLATLIEKGTPQLQHKAAWSLAAIGRPSVEALKILSRHGDQNVRYFAVFALGHIGLAHAAETVYARLRDESALVRDEAALALAKIKPQTRRGQDF